MFWNASSIDKQLKNKFGVFVKKAYIEAHYEEDYIRKINNIEWNRVAVTIRESGDEKIANWLEQNLSLIPKVMDNISRIA